MDLTGWYQALGSALAFGALLGLVVAFVNAWGADR